MPNEVQLCQDSDTFAILGRLQAKVKALQCFDWRKLGGSERDINPACFLGRVFLTQQSIDGLNNGDVTLLQLLQSMVKRFKRTDMTAQDSVQILASDEATP